MNLEERALAIPSRASALIITTAEDYVRAGELLLDIKDTQKGIDAIFNPVISANHEAWQKALAQKKKVSAPLREAEDIIKPRMTAWKNEQDCIREREEERLRQEALRAEEERKLQEALEAEASGDKEMARAILEEPVIAPSPILPPTPKVDGISMSKNWKFRIVDESKIPREYLMVDEVKIGKVVRALKGDVNIPGIEPYAIDRVAAGRR